MCCQHCVRLCVLQEWQRSCLITLLYSVGVRVLQCVKLSDMGDSPPTTPKPLQAVVAPCQLVKDSSHSAHRSWKAVPNPRDLWGLVDDLPHPILVH